MQYLHEPAIPSLPIEGDVCRFPVHRIYCVGRNFAEHAKEMGATVERGQPVLFTKPADAVVAEGDPVPYPSATSDLHHEVELVIALGRDAAGVVPVDHADALVFGYAVGLDLTRRDLQARAKAKGLPWDIAKGFDASAPLSRIMPGPYPRSERLWLEVNGTQRQAAPLSDMIYSVAEVINELSKLYRLRAGDLIFMGTPAGVAALQPGDAFRAGIDGCIEFSGTIAAP